VAVIDALTARSAANGLLHAKIFLPNWYIFHSYDRSGVLPTVPKCLDLPDSITASASAADVQGNV
jgi:hypothetical protein